MKTITSARIFAGLALIGCCLALTSCSTVKATAPSGDESSFWKPYLLYLLASPHSRLYVEVDAVTGCEPSQEALDKLRDFLAVHCNKPGGIEIVRSDVIPVSAAQGVSPRTLAREFINGPPDKAESSPPAFLYVLYYDGALSDKPAPNTNQPGANPPPRLHVRREHPHVDLLPYPAAIFINMQFGGKTVQKWVGNDLLLHEAGHVMGLAGRPTAASNYHCLDTSCMMYKTFRMSVSRLLLGRDPIKQHHLCARCLAQLTDEDRQSPAPNLRFVGPVLVRSEEGYHVLTLPYRAEVVVGELTDQDCRDFAIAVRAEPPGLAPDAECRVTIRVKDETFRDPATTNAWSRAKSDPYKAVQIGATKLWSRVFARLYYDAGQFARSVEIHRQAILFDPKDDWSYNELAWIKATCSDPAIRDGREAVAHARKACELTQWKDWNQIDTLAAACAEAGDFKRAIEFANRALHTGNPSETDQKGIRERISLYEQSRPIRSTP